jgi:glutamate carboxypeptidase
MPESSEIKRIQHYLEERWPFYQEILQQMVGINSFSANRSGIDELGKLTAGIFLGLDFQPEFVPHNQPMYGNHLFLTRPGRTKRTIGLVSHLDTVFTVTEERQNNFSWRVEGDRLYGPGTVDIKGGTVLIYMVLDTLRHFAPQVFENITWQVMLDAAEEADGEHFGSLCRERLPAGDTTACLVFEGGRLQDQEALLVVTRKGMAVYRVTVDGRAAHAGTAHASGANAIVQLARTIDQIAGFTDYDRQITFNVGTVAGGTVVNRVPHFASAFVEMRAFDLQVFQEGMAKMLALPEQADISSATDEFTCQIRVEVMRTMPAWPHNPQTKQLFSLWREAGEQTGIQVVPEERGGLSDGNYLWQHVPTLDGLGPSGGNAHCSERSADGSKDQEYADSASFIPKALLNTLGILSLVA